MGFKRVKFVNFRNIEPQEVKISGGLNLLTGFNGSGKTNFLEGLNILSGWSTLESGTKTRDLVQRGSEKREVLLTGQKDDEYGDIIQAKIGERYSIRYNNEQISATELRFRMPVLCFLPNDTQLVEGAAARRRRLLNVILALIVPAYAKRISEYTRAVKQKAALLKRREKTEQIDKVIKPLAVWIWKMRKEAVLLLNKEIKKQDKLVPENTELTFFRGGANIKENEEDDFIAGIEEKREKEKQSGMPLVGPHRDDLVIKTNEELSANVLSRGFRRRTAVALMLAAGDSVYRKTGNIPTLLLDEVTAELDAEGRAVLFGTLRDRKAQVFAATAEPFTEHFFGTIYKVDKGKVEVFSE